MKKYSHKNKLGKLDRKPDNWSLFGTYELEKFNDPVEEAIEIDQQVIYQSLNIGDDLSRLYNLYYYIQQEDNTYFLKKPGKKRMESIAHLFDTKVEQEEKEKIENVRKKLMNEKDQIKKEINETNKRIQSYNDFIKDTEEYKPEYISLFSNLIPQKEWDRKDLKVETRQQRDKYIADLNELEDFIYKYDEFKKASFNKSINQVSVKSKLLQNTIIGFNFLKEYEQIKNNYEKRERLKKLYKLLERDNILDNINDIKFSNIKEETNLDIDLVNIEDIRQDIILQLNSADELSRIIKKLNDTRSQLIQHNNEFLEKEEESSGECPFCGYEWNGLDNLLKEVESKRKSFSGFYDSSIQTVEDKVEELYKKHLDAVLERMATTLNSDQSEVNKDFFKQLKTAMANMKEIQNLNAWCKSNDIDISPYVNKEKNKPVEDIKKAEQGMSEFLLGQKKQIQSVDFESDDRLSSFEQLYKDTFGQSEELVNSINIEMIEQKKAYINFSFYNNNFQKLREEENHLKKLKNIGRKLENNILDLKSICDKYDIEIKKHWNKVMKDIEIPFYIYSGKIIQEYQKGLGLFIEESQSGEAKSIKFVSDNSYDHDAINFLSSGQLSALVISFTLALNKVYGNQSLNIIMIDDPVQTMDEINMASFTELLRNEFSHKQIIISTHENDVSRYLRYKFKKYGLKSVPFNVKEQIGKAIN